MAIASAAENEFIILISSFSFNGLIAIIGEVLLKKLLKDLIQEVLFNNNVKSFAFFEVYLMFQVGFEDCSLT